MLHPHASELSMLRVEGVAIADFHSLHLQFVWRRRQYLRSQLGGFRGPHVDPWHADAALRNKCPECVGAVSHRVTDLQSHARHVAELPLS